MTFCCLHDLICNIDSHRWWWLDEKTVRGVLCCDMSDCVPVVQLMDGRGGANLSVAAVHNAE